MGYYKQKAIEEYEEMMLGVPEEPETAVQEDFLAALSDWLLSNREAIVRMVNEQSPLIDFK